jgi:hypothetical protein
MTGSGNRAYFLTPPTQQFLSFLADAISESLKIVVDSGFCHGHYTLALAVAEARIINTCHYRYSENYSFRCLILPALIKEVSSTQMPVA